VNDMSHTCHVRYMYVYAWRYDGRHVHILTIVILGGGSCRIAPQRQRQESRRERMIPQLASVAIPAAF
jgi:hypothetical protein